MTEKGKQGRGERKWDWRRGACFNICKKLIEVTLRLKTPLRCFGLKLSRVEFKPTISAYHIGSYPYSFSSTWEVPAGQNHFWENCYKKVMANIHDDINRSKDLLVWPKWRSILIHIVLLPHIRSVSIHFIVFWPIKQEQLKIYWKKRYKRSGATLEEHPFEENHRLETTWSTLFSSPPSCSSASATPPPMGQQRRARPCPQGASTL